MPKYPIALVFSGLVACAPAAPGTIQEDGGRNIVMSGVAPDAGPLTPPLSGMQLHVEPYTLAAGAESVECRVLSANHPAMHLSGLEISERFGMHHMTLYTGPAGAADPCAGSLSPIFLAQGGREHVDLSGGAPEYKGATLEIPAGTFAAKVHALNSTEGDVTIEAWINLETQDFVALPLAMISLSATGMKVPPHSQQTYSASVISPGDLTIVELVGHTHVHTTEQTATVGVRTVYDSTNWSEPSPSWFTSLTEPLSLKKGETLAWSCAINNDTDAVLAYGEKAQTGEMCNLFGYWRGSVAWVAAQ